MTSLLEPRRRIVKTVKLYRKQQEFRQSTAIRCAFCGGRGAGKSWVLSYKMIRRAKRGRTYLMAAPTGPMLMDTTYPTFKAIAIELGVWNPRGVRLRPYPTVELTTGATIRFRTAENPEMLRGPNLSGASLEEASLMVREAMTITIACLREGGDQGWLDAGFTPKGQEHWTYDEFATGKPNTHLVRAATRENKFLHADFAANLAAAYTRAEAEQEIEGMFLDSSDAFQVIPAAWIRDAMSRWKPDGAAGQKLSSAGFDVAMGGDCDSAIAKRYGSWFAPVLTIPGRATTTGEASAAWVREHMRGDERALINVDTFGVGADAYGHLCRWGFNCAPINGGLPTTATNRTGTLRFANLRAFAYWSLRELLDPTSLQPGQPAPQLPPDDDLLQELAAHRWKPVGGVVILEKKEETSKRIKNGRSPDKADALALSILLPPGLEHAA